MANWSTLKAAIANVIKTNENQEITGQLMQNVLTNVISSVGKNATYAGVATPGTSPGVPDGPVFYFASAVGTYSNFGGIVISAANTLEVIYNNPDSSWGHKVIFDGGVLAQKIAQTQTQLEQTQSQLDRINGFIAISELDSMATDIKSAREFARKSSNKTLKYIVFNGNFIVGTLDIISDDSCHQITQILTSHYTDGTFISHDDNSITTFYRSFNISAPSYADAAPGEWSEWREVIPHGAAPLGADGKVPETNLPELGLIIEFSAMMAVSSVLLQSSAHKSTDDGCAVVYDTSNNRFLLRVASKSSDSPIISIDYYANWLDADKFGKSEAGNWRPESGNLYINTGNNRPYYLKGGTLVMCGSDLRLGEGPYDAFPGDRGLAIEENLSTPNSETREAIKKDLFIDMWNAACGSYGTYNAESGFFELNGLTDITYEQALAIYNAGAIENANIYGRYYGAQIRTNLPINNGLSTRGYTGYAFSGRDIINWSAIEVLNLDTNRAKIGLIRFTLSNMSAHDSIFGQHGGCLRRVIGCVDLGNYSVALNHLFPNCINLEEVNIEALHANFNISSCGKLSLATMQYMVKNRGGTTTITITVHPDVYAKIVGDTTNEAAAALTPEELEQWQALVPLAAEKNIQFATV